MSLDSKSISVLIVNYNSGVYALECIHSLLKQRGETIEIIVVDNASQDDSVKLLRETFDGKIILVESKENLGFGRANNLAASKASGEFLLLLNPDTVITEPNVLKAMVDTLKNNPHIGLLGPAIDEPRKAKQVLPRYRYPSSRHLKYTNKFKRLPGEIAWLLGACMLIKRSVFAEVKGFDPDFFLYGEDADICLRLRLAGYEIGYCDKVQISHVGGASEFGANSLDKWLRKKRGVFLFCTKHFDPRDALEIAKTAIFKSRLYLGALFVTNLFRNKNSVVFVDKKHRLQATIITAKEVLNQLKSKAK